MSKKLMIMEKAIELFSKNGVESTSIQDITNACGISKGAFYLSFKSKDDLLVEITDYFIKNLSPYKTKFWMTASRSMRNCRSSFTTISDYWKNIIPLFPCACGKISSR